jgi:hypothetical protein
MSVPLDPRIYHITHVDNLRSMALEGVLVSHATITKRGGPSADVGMGEIKRRRLVLPVDCHAGDCVGDYVPFYFCPRSVMLFVIHRANHPGLTYRGGQGPIVHLEADLRAVVDWCDRTGRRWAFSLSNASARYVEFRRSLADLAEVNWAAVAATDFRSSAVSEGKQAEFLVHGEFPWHLVARIGVHSPSIRTQALAALRGAAHGPPVVVQPDWYY